MSDQTTWHQAMFGVEPNPQAKAEADNARAAASWTSTIVDGVAPTGQTFAGEVDTAMGRRAAAAKRDLRLAFAQAEVEQARLEMDRLGAFIGNPPLPMQEATHQAALARLRALEAEQ